MTIYQLNLSGTIIVFKITANSATHRLTEPFPFSDLIFKTTHNKLWSVDNKKPASLGRVPISVLEIGFYTDFSETQRPEPTSIDEAD
jgi:hypothetical protein